MSFHVFAFGLVHVICVFLLWTIFTGYLVPGFVCDVCASAASYAVCTVIAYYSFRFVKLKWIDRKVDPENKAVFITGCDTGFGHLLAKRLDRAGFHVFAGCLFPEGKGAHDLKESCSKNLVIVPLDVTKDGSVQKAAGIVKEKLGLVKDLWALVNNAGIVKGWSTDLSQVDDFKDCLDVNTLGTIRLTKALLPFLKDCEPDGPRIVNVTSLGGRLAVQSLTPYATSKFASSGFTECLRQELYYWGIKVVAVEPEFFLTPMANIESNIQRMNLAFASLDPTVRKDYGEKFFQRLLKIATDSNSLFSPDVDNVVDSLENAVSLEHPDHTYRPCRNFLVACCCEIALLLPISVLNLGILVIWTLGRYPIPERMKKKERFNRL